MGDAAKTLREQLEHWERVAAEAEENLRVAKAAIPGLREGLRQIEGAKSAPEPAASAPLATPAPPSPTPEASGGASDDGSSLVQPETSNDAQQLVEIKRADDVRDAVRKVVASLEGEFDQNAIKDGLRQHGYVVNSSTLRGNLKIMNDLNDSLKITSEGRGRRATIFSRI